MTKDVNMKLDLHPAMTIGQLISILIRDFRATGLNKADFDIPGTDGEKQLVMHFDISLHAVDTSAERKH